MALATQRVRLGPMVTPLPRRRPWQVVRQVVTLDHLSGGRAVLGVGLGFPPHEEFGVFGSRRTPRPGPGSWPHRAPFRRAARWDGVVPIMASEQMLPTIEDMRAIVAYTLEAFRDQVRAGPPRGDDRAPDATAARMT